MCIDPMTTKNSGDIPVPCGRCVECKARRASAWSFRLMQEAKRSLSAHFLTLTYDEEKLKAEKQSILSQNGFLSLSRPHLTLFFKRLRKAHESNFRERRIKYYACGEYGSQTFRPHYHIILFNAVFELIENAWVYGAIHYGDVQGASIGYCLKYISKTKKIPMHRNDDREPEYSVMSKNLGTNYLTEQMISWHKADLENRCYLNLQDGKKCSMPRYYKDRIYSDAERETIAAKACITANRKLEKRQSRALEQGEVLLTARQIQSNAQELMEIKSKRNSKL